MRFLKTIVYMVILFQGLRILLLSSYQAQSLGALLILIGYVALKRETPKIKGRRESIFLPLAGVIVIIGDIYYNLVVKHSNEFQSLDAMTILLGFTLIAYQYIPQKNEREVRFLIVFFSVFFLSLSLPLALLNFSIGGRAASIYSNMFLAKPLTILLNLVGIEAGNAYNWVYYMGKVEWMQLGMGISCSGVYSLAIFISAYTAYIYIRYQKVSGKMMLLLIAGIIGTYFANLLRVFVIALIGYQWGKGLLLVAHNHFGWMIFMAWIIPFWYVAFKIILRGEKKD